MSLVTWTCIKFDSLIFDQHVDWLIMFTNQAGGKSARFDWLVMKWFVDYAACLMFDLDGTGRLVDWLTCSRIELMINQYDWWLANPTRTRSCEEIEWLIEGWFDDWQEETCIKFDSFNDWSIGWLVDDMFTNRANGDEQGWVTWPSDRLILKDNECQQRVSMHRVRLISNWSIGWLIVDMLTNRADRH